MNIQIAKRNVKVSTLISLAGVLMALLLALTWLMPVVNIFDEPYTMLKAADIVGGSDGAQAKAGVWCAVVLSALPIVWFVLNKKWAVIVGAFYSMTPLILCNFQVNDWKAHDEYFDLAIGAKLMIPLAVLGLLLAFARLVVFIIDQKKNQVNNGAAAQTPEG